MISAEAIRAALTQTPFRPLRLNLKEGRSLPVFKPATTSVIADMVNVGLYAQGETGATPDYYERVPVGEIASVEPMPHQPPEARSVPPAEILFLLRARPFVPFRIVLQDGRTYDIPHPELCMVGLGSMVVGVVEPEHAPLYRVSHTVSTRHVIRLEPIPQDTAHQNGEVG